MNKLFNNIFSQRIFVSLTFFFMAVLSMTLLSLANPQTVQAQCGPAGCCSSLGGSCMFPVSGATYDCAGGIVDNYCPAPSNYRCCLPTTTACYQQQAGKCQTVGGSQGCSTSYASGFCPGPSAIRCCVNQQPEPTNTPTPTPIGPCGDSTSPTGSIISTGVNTSASSVLGNDQNNYGPQNIVDGVFDPTHYWNAGNFPPQWVEINLGAPQPVSGIKLFVRQNPNGVMTHQILTGTTPNPSTVSRTLNCYTQNDDIINVVFNPPLNNVQYIRINTPSGVAWVAWNEINVFGSAPGAQTSTPGIIFSGDGSAQFGQGSASTQNWVVGGLTYPEVYEQTGPSPTSYQILLEKITNNNIPITDMTTLSGCSNLTNCTLPPNLPNGVYRANNNLTLNTYSFPLNRNYVFLINGNLRVNGHIIVPNGSTAFFTASNDIIIDRNVGTAINLFPLPAGQLQGIYSADRDFVVDGINDCVAGKDKMLNVEGSIVTNALGNGGTFRTERDLCGDNPRYPSLSIRLRLDMLLNLPLVLMQQKTSYREDTP